MHFVLCATTDCRFASVTSVTGGNPRFTGVALPRQSGRDKARVSMAESPGIETLHCCRLHTVACRARRLLYFVQCSKAEAKSKELLASPLEQDAQDNTSSLFPQSDTSDMAALCNAGLTLLPLSIVLAPGPGDACQSAEGKLALVKCYCRGWWRRPSGGHATRTLRPRALLPPIPLNSLDSSALPTLGV